MFGGAHGAATSRKGLQRLGEDDPRHPSRDEDRGLMLKGIQPFPIHGRQIDCSWVRRGAAKRAQFGKNQVVSSWKLQPQRCPMALSRCPSLTAITRDLVLPFSRVTGDTCRRFYGRTNTEPRANNSDSLTDSDPNILQSATAHLVELARSSKGGR